MTVGAEPMPARGPIPGSPSPAAAWIGRRDTRSSILERMSATLKANLNRTVLLERDGEGGVVIKRFHSPGALRKLADGMRAAREFRVLTGLRDRGVSVPAPLELRKQDECWEVLIEWIPGAFPLDEFLSGRRPLPSQAGDLARKLARLLAQAWSCGLVHSDLHPGNVLLDPDGELWLIDFQHAKLRDVVPPRRVHRDLVHLAAELRELVSPRFRARFLVELLRHSPAATVEALPPARELARAVEDEARINHRHRVHRRQLRWTRESSSCRALASDQHVGWIRKEIEPHQERSLIGLAQTDFDATAVQLSNGFEVQELETRDSAWIAIRAQDASVLLEAWYTAARVREHGLPAPEPVLMLEEPEARVLLRDPFRCRPLHKTLESLQRSERHRLCERLMALLGSLHDRGLALADLSAETFRVHAGRPTFGGPLEVVAATPARRIRDRQAVAELLELQDAPERERTDWSISYCNAWRGHRSELSELLQEMRDD